MFTLALNNVPKDVIRKIVTLGSVQVELRAFTWAINASRNHRSGNIASRECDILLLMSRSFTHAEVEPCAKCIASRNVAIFKMHVTLGSRSETGMRSTWPSCILHAF